MKKEEITKLLNKISVVRESIKKLKPFGTIKKVVKFNRSAHITLPKELLGKEVLVLDLEEIKKIKKSK